MLENGHLVV